MFIATQDTHSGSATATNQRPPLPGSLEFLFNLLDEQGDRARYRSAYGEVFYFNDPDDVRNILQSQNFVRTPLVTVLLGQGLLASDGPYWKSQRKLMQPAFREPCVHSFLPVVRHCTDEWLRHWESAAASELAIDVAADMRQLSLDIILRCLFSTSLGEDLARVDRSVTSIIDDLGQLAGTFFNQPHKFSPGRNTDFKTALAELDALVQGIMEQAGRKSPDGTHGSHLMPLLMGGIDSTTGERLTEKQIRDEVVTMILGGHETTAVILTWAWHLLASHPEVEARLAQELEQTLMGAPPTHADLGRLTYTRCVFQEVMRLYPPVWFMMRKSLSASSIGGQEIPAGGSALICPYTTHRHPSHWDAPWEFRPERFHETNAASRHKYAYLPFSAGRHQCLGMGFAMMEGPLILAALAQRFRVAPCSPVVEIAPVLTLRQRQGLPSRILHRKPSIAA